MSKINLCMATAPNITIAPKIKGWWFCRKETTCNVLQIMVIKIFKLLGLKIHKIKKLIDCRDGY